MTTTWTQFIQQIIMLAVSTGCVVAVLLATANNPYDGDEITRGLPAGAAGYMAASMMKRKMCPLE